MSTYRGVGEIARELRVNPTLITNLFYQGKLPADRCPIAGGRRLVPPSVVPEIIDALKEKGVEVHEPEAQPAQ